MWMDLSLILFNIGNTAQRLNYFKTVFDKYLHNGVRILINDAHKPAIRAHLQRLLRLYEHRYLGVKEQTLDEYSRFCVLIEGK
jgi:predicted glycosyltransferase